MHQHPLFSLEEIFDRPFKRYELFFSVLDLSDLDKNPSVGRKPISRTAILRALIFKNLRTIANLSDLSTELFERPTLSQILGFEPSVRPIPVERFSAFLKNTDNDLLQNVRLSLVRKTHRLRHHNRKVPFCRFLPHTGKFKRKQSKDQY
jgi:hypothetical protein